MDVQALKNKIINGQLTDAELLDLLSGKTSASEAPVKSSFLKDILKGFIEGYTAPMMWKITMEFVLILAIITGVILLSYAGRMEAMVTAVMLAAILGFLFGKMK
jgi:hypothetical protein